MRILSKATVKQYYTKHPQATAGLVEWLEKTEKAEWNGFEDMKKTFNSVDYVGNNRYVFNIQHNDFRLIVMVLFTPKQVYIRFIGTHSEYDKIKDIKNI